MSNDDVLDLSQVDPSIWRVMVKEVVYGPYTLGQMRSFVVENRLTPKSKTAEGDGAPFIPAGEQPALTEVFQSHFAEKNSKSASKLANHVIVVKSMGDSRNRVISVLNTLGRFTETMPGVFLLRTATRTAKIRELLDDVADDRDRILIVNADDGRLAWSGLGPELDSHIRSVWQQKPEI